LKKLFGLFPAQQCIIITLDSPNKKDALARRFCQIDCCIGVDHSNAVLNTLSTPIFKSSFTHISAFGNKPNSFDSTAWFELFAKV